MGPHGGFLKHKEHEDPLGSHKGQISTYRRARCAFKVGGNSGQKLRCFVVPWWVFVSFVFQPIVPFGARD